jgi:hypothetical protein
VEVEGEVDDEGEGEVSEDCSCDVEADELEY